MQGTPARAGEAGGAPAKQPEGMDTEARLLTSFAEVALHSKAWVRQAPEVGACIDVRRTASHASPCHGPQLPPGSWLAVYICEANAVLCCYVQVQYTQRNLAANSMRKFIVSHNVNQFGAPITYGMPMELKDVILYTPSPSGAPSAPNLNGDCYCHTPH